MIRGAIIFSLLLAFGALRLPIESALTRATSQRLFSRSPTRARSARTNRTARVSRRPERFSFARRGCRLHPGARRLGTHRVGPRPPAFPRSDHAPAALDPLLGHGGVAHGLERERRRPARSGPAERGPPPQGASTNMFALGKDFLERGIKNNPDRPQLYESLARLYKEKLNDHAAAAKYYATAPPPCRAPRNMTNASPPTSFPTRPATSARPMKRSASFTTGANMSACRLCSRV